MPRIAVFARYVVVAAGLACIVAYTLPVWAEGAGYEGLIAPASPERDSSDSGSGTGSSAGYEGLLAPATAAHEEAPAGYVGVLPGHTAKMTPVPGTANIDETEFPPDIRTLSTIFGQDRDADGVPDALHEPKKFTSVTGHSYIKGRPSETVTAEEQAAHMIASIEDKNISPEQRAENLRLAYQQLNMMVNAVRSRRAIPDSIYKKMGLSDAYIQEEKANINTTLASLNKSIAELSKY